ncbi:MAG: polyhydroxyalkanoate synthesis regulator DNA-binding domain-containing protein, partial [Bryobacteraceae bacterium]
MQTVRRYANRKFYHLQGHRYITLEGIATLVRSG